MIDLGGKTDFRRLEGIVYREGDRQEEDTACVW